MCKNECIMLWRIYSCFLLYKYQQRGNPMQQLFGSYWLLLFFKIEHFMVNSTNSSICQLAQFDWLIELRIKCDCMSRFIKRNFRNRIAPKSIVTIVIDCKAYLWYSPFHTIKLASIFRTGARQCWRHCLVGTWINLIKDRDFRVWIVVCDSLTLRDVHRKTEINKAARV